MSIHITQQAARKEASRLEIESSKMGTTPGRSSGHRFQQYTAVPFMGFLWKVVKR